MARWELKLKLRMLWDMKKTPIIWYNVIWKVNGSDRICCSGYECGCQGADNASYWEYLLSRNLS